MMSCSAKGEGTRRKGREEYRTAGPAAMPANRGLRATKEEKREEWHADEHGFDGFARINRSYRLDPRQSVKSAFIRVQFPLSRNKAAISVRRQLDQSQKPIVAEPAASQDNVDSYRSSLSRL